LYKRKQYRTCVAGFTGCFHLEDYCDEMHLIGDYFEREQLVEFLRLLDASDIVWEVGGAIGAWTVFLAQRAVCGQVHVFEPEPRNHLRLLRNIELNNLLNVKVHKLAASSSNGRAEFGVAGTEHGGSHSLIVGQLHQRVIQVPTIRLDNAREKLEIPRPTAVKIDCEGGEWDVLMGMSRLLALGAVRVILLEIHPPDLKRIGHTHRELMAIVENAGYAVIKRWNRDEEVLVVLERRQHVHLERGRKTSALARSRAVRATHAGPHGTRGARA
jgi:FkbM family methyltransferase